MENWKKSLDNELTRASAHTQEQVKRLNKGLLEQNLHRYTMLKFY